MSFVVNALLSISTDNHLFQRHLSRGLLTTAIAVGCLLYAELSHSAAYNDLIEVNPSYNDGTIVIEQTVADLAKQRPVTNISVMPPSPQQTKSTAAKITEVTPQRIVKIAIIIDDIGYNYQQGIEAIQLPGAITYAIIPHSPKATFFAAEARKNNKEIMLHAPMSTVHNTPLGDHGLSAEMSESDFKQTLRQSLDSLPEASGVNNHMGSLLTQKTLPMEWVMQSLQERQLYFIDSRTTSNSVAWQTAQAFSIPSLTRDIFLDHQQTTEFIHQQFLDLKRIAKKRGYAIAIGHPYKETIQYLRQHLPSLAAENIQLVPASELVEHYSPHQISSNVTKSVNSITEHHLR